MDTTLLLISSWISGGLFYLTLLIINREKTLSILIKKLNILKKYIAQNSKENSSKSGSRLNNDDVPQSIEDFSVPQPEPNKSKFVFYTILYSKIILFYWIIYLIIIACGTIVERIYPELGD